MFGCVAVCMAWHHLSFLCTLQELQSRLVNWQVGIFFNDYDCRKDFSVEFVKFNVLVCCMWWWLWGGGRGGGGGGGWCMQACVLHGGVYSRRCLVLTVSSTVFNYCLMLRACCFQDGFQCSCYSSKCRQRSFILYCL